MAAIIAAWPLVEWGDVVEGPAREGEI